MECPPPVRRKDGEIDWVEAARKYLDVVSSGDEGAAVRATLEVKRMVSHAPDLAVRLAVWALVGRLLDRSPSPRLQAAASQALCSVVRVDGGKFADEIVDAGFFPVAQRLLPESEEVPQRILLRCLSCILSFHANSRVVFARGGGTEVILDLFQGCSGATRRHLVEILSALALVREVRRLILADGKVEYLVEAISFGNLVSRTRAAQATGLLGASTNGRSSLVEMGAPLALVGLMRDGDSSAKLVAANALGIISSIGHLPLIHQSGAIPLYAELLKENHPFAKDIAEDVFCILVSISGNAALVLENLAGFLRGEDDLAISSAVDVLLALAEYKSIIPFLKSSGVITVLVDLLQNGNHDVVEKVTGVVAQLSYEEYIREGLMEAGAIPILLDLLHGDLEDLTESAAAEALINFSEDPSCQEYAPMLQRVPEISAFRDHLLHFRISQSHLTQYARRRIEQRLNSQ